MTARDKRDIGAAIASRRRVRAAASARNVLSPHGTAAAPRVGAAVVKDMYVSLVTDLDARRGCMRW
jgi:hypothetical protein